MKTIIHHILILLTVVTTPFSMRAFSTDIYSPTSVLSSGRWIKVSVEESGVHFISTSALRSWGFTDPSKVRIFGYGGARIPDYMTRANYVDDLPVVKSEAVNGGIVFYAQGPGTWTHERNDIYNHSLNPYSTHGYYFISDSQPEADNKIITEGSEPTADAATTFIERIWHENELVSPAESGHQLVGEDFRYTTNRTFNFQLPGRVADTEVWMQCDFFAKSASAPLTINFTANGQNLPSVASDRVRMTSEWGDTCRIRKRFVPSGTSLALGIKINISAPVNLANLDRLTLTYTRELSLPSSGTLEFSSMSRSLRLGGVKSETRVWDVTDPVNPIAMPLTQDAGGNAGWTNDYTGQRTYAAWTSTSSLPSPRLVSLVSNQNLHAEPTPDMVIISPTELLEQSRRIAAIHSSAPRNLNVLVVSAEQVYNEFGSGSPDINALRRMLKMFYDRGNAAGAERTLKYVLLMGGANHDHRRLTSAVAGSASLTLPIWQTELCNSESYSYCSDDPIAFLEDNSGLRMASDRLSVAVGRIPARSVSAAKTYVDRFENYVNKPVQSEWRNRMLMFADEGNSGQHMEQTDTMEMAMRRNPTAPGFTFHKVFIDAYELRNGTSEEAKTKVSNLFNDGVIIWSYIGHGAINTLSGDGIFTPAFLNNLYLRHPFFFYGATCTFGALDGSAVSGMESLLMTDAGGAIGGFCAVRPVYIVRNGPLSNAFGTQMVTREADGNVQPIGEVFRKAKNSLSGDDNVRRYILFADPALRLAIPANTVRLTSINGVEVDGDAQPILPASSRSVVKGEVCDNTGNRIDSFNGWLSLSLYDAERSFTTHGRGTQGTPGKEVTFDEQGERLYTGRTLVTAGEFELVIPMPAEIADNFRPATMSMFAASDDGLEASGVCRDLYAYGVDENAIPDDVAPLIEYIYLNHSTFKPSDEVDASPMLIARVSDDVGLNMSSAGVGHQMTVRIDGDMNFTDVSSHFTPDSDGTPAGTIFYQLPELSAGNHTATLKVWDTGGNSSSASVDFFVNPESAPKIFDIYSDANPATTEANFYVSHNRPDATLTVKIEIFDFNGALVWTSETQGRADMYASAPVKWNLTSKSGSRVGRGIYLYRATISSGGKTSSQTKRIAVAPM
ncbi:MAG: type IX secretion system sortase PorU [Bacteroides sp.]|nr:type IX secretion system sortase PorU [Bacteroides sp.]